MVSLLLDVVVAWLLAKFVPAGGTRMLLGLLGGWISAAAGSVLVGLAFGWTVPEMLQRLTIGLLVHPLVIAGLIWLYAWLTRRGKNRPESA